MSTLQDQLLKLGLVDEKPVDKPRTPSAKPRATPAYTGPDRSAAQAPAAKAAPEPPPPVDPNAPRPKIGPLVSKGALSKTEGRKKFYFDARDDRVVYVELDDNTVTKLTRGDAAVAEAPSGKVTIIDRDTALRVEAYAPEWVRFRR